MSITRINHFEAKAGCETDLFNFMQSVIDTIRSAQGCLNCKLLKGAENTAHLAVIEEWVSIEHHQAAASLIPKEQLQQAITLFAKPPFGIYFQSV
jgi:quinol monooxygenase YgiN